MKMEIIPFGRNDLDNILVANPERANDLPYGAILLNRSGVVLNYNKAEGFHAGREPSEVIGRVFFKDVAACAVDTRLFKEFLGYHKSGFANVVFDYNFDYKGVPASMRIHLKSTQDGEACWMFVKRV